jgi:hypothetical protein
MIVVVAPYSPVGRAVNAHLGASRKLETVISILSRLDSELVLVNSAHNETEPAPLAVSNAQIAGVSIIEITPPVSNNRTIGKLKNVLNVDVVFEEVRKLGRPNLVWLYNGYAFEMRFALAARRKLGVPLVLEFEDWHFSRSRGLNPKPMVDFLIWRKAARHITTAFAVNMFLASRMQPFVNDVQMLPGVVPSVLPRIANSNPPFSSNDGHINVGYFGGLSVEKGADITLEISKALPPGYTLHVCGTGPLEPRFIEQSQQAPEQLQYYGPVDDTTLYRIIAKCDVILNPHRSISKMDNGVFPFKVIEAVASARLLVSTELPSNGIDELMEGVHFVEHSVSAFYEAVLSSRERYLRYEISIKRAAAVADLRFGEIALQNKIRSILN